MANFYTSAPVKLAVRSAPMRDTPLFINAPPELVLTKKKKNGETRSRARLNTPRRAVARAAAHVRHSRCGICTCHSGCAHHGIRAMLRVTDVIVKRSDNGIITISVTYFADADNCATRRAKLSPPRGFDAPPQIVR